jgi:hypothetical protein
MAEVTGRIGDNDVALDNAATEATLKALLLAMTGSTKRMDQLINLASKSGMDPKAIAEANKGANALGQAAFGAGKIASVAMNGLAKGALVLGGVIGDLAASAFKTVGNLTDFAGKLLDGTASVSGLFGAFKDLPLGLGLVAGLFEKMAQFQEANLAAFRDLSKVGVNLGGDLNQVRLQALEAGLTMQEYGSVIKENAKSISLLGTSTDDGARAFRGIAKTLTTGNLGNNLLALGYGFKDISDLTANYIKVNAGLSDAQKKDYRGVAASVANYGKELDVLARLTGKSREELEKQQESMTQDANFQNYLNGLDENEREKANAALRLAMESGGKGAADALKAKLMGLPPLTEEAQMYVATMREGGQSIEDFYKIVKNGKTLQQSQNELDKTFSKAVSGNIKDLKQFETVMRAGGMTGDKFASTLMSVQDTVNKYKAKGLTEEAAIQQAIRDEREKQLKQNGSAAAAAAQAEKALKALGSELMGALLPVFEAMGPVVSEVAKSLLNFARENMPAIKEGAKMLGDFLQRFVKDIFTKEGQDKIINDILWAFKNILIEVKKGILPSWLYDEKDAERDRKKLDAEKAVYDAKAAAARVAHEIQVKEQLLNDSAKANADDKKKLTAEEKARIETELAALKKLKPGQDALIKQKEEEAKKALAGNDVAPTPSARTRQKMTEAQYKDRATEEILKSGIDGKDVTIGMIAKKVEELKKKDAEEAKKVPPAARTGGVFDGPKTGYDVTLHGNEAVVPLGGGGITRSSIKEFINGLPSANDVASKIQNVANNPQAALADATKAVTEFGQKLVKAADPMVRDATQGVKGGLESLGVGGNEKLIAELQTLNNISRQTLGYIKRAVEFDERQLEATRSLNGNLYQ